MRRPYNLEEPDLKKIFNKTIPNSVSQEAATSTTFEGVEMEEASLAPRIATEPEGEGLRAALAQAEERAPPPPAHALKHDLLHSQPVSTSMRFLFLLCSASVELPMAS